MHLQQPMQQQPMQQQPMQQQPMQQQPMQQQPMQQQPMQQQPIENKYVISNENDIPDEFNFLPMKVAPLPVIPNQNANQIKQVPLKSNAQTQENINFLRNLN
jgi:hypothetical protein